MAFPTLDRATLAQRRSARARLDLAALGQVKSHWRGIAGTVGVNWLVKPFSMALLGWLFIGHLFRPLLPPSQFDGYMAGLILLAAAPCTAMVFVWSNLVDGEPHFTLSQVALNDMIMVVAFAPLVTLQRALGRSVADQTLMRLGSPPGLLDNAVRVLQLLWQPKIEMV